MLIIFLGMTVVPTLGWRWMIRLSVTLLLFLLLLFRVTSLPTLSFLNTVNSLSAVSSTRCCHIVKCGVFPSRCVVYPGVCPLQRVRGEREGRCGDPSAHRHDEPILLTTGRAGGTSGGEEREGRTGGESQRYIKGEGGKGERERQVLE